MSYKPLPPNFDGSVVPPAGTVCSDCGCCQAGIYAGAERVPICMACDEGILCQPQQRLAMKTFEQQQGICDRCAQTTHECLCNAPRFEDVVEAAAAENAAHTYTAAPTEEITNMPKLCKGGCGKGLPPANKNGFAWGHSNGCPADAPPPRTPEATAEAQPDGDEVPLIELNLSEDQLDRIWQSLPLEEKGLAIITALAAERE